jgi:hypothetical protein
VSCANRADRRESLPLRLPKRGEVTSRGTIRLRVHFDGGNRRPHLVWVRPRLLSIEQIIERLEDLRDLIPDRMTGNG